MTVKESILACPGLSDVDDSLLTRVLIARSLNDAADATPENSKEINLATADLYVWVVNSPDFSESKLSMTFPRQHWINTAKRLYRENGEPEKANRIGVRLTGRARNTW